MRSQVQISPELQTTVSPTNYYIFLAGTHSHPTTRGKLYVKGVIVKQLRNPQDIFVKARKEVILSAGAFESAKLLMLSGVGPADQLAHFHIPLVKDLPVGQTLYEHMGVMGPVILVPKAARDGLINLERVATVK